MSLQSGEGEASDVPMVTDEIFIGADKISVTLRILEPVWIKEIGEACNHFGTLLRDQLPLEESRAHILVGKNDVFVRTSRQTPVTEKELKAALNQFEEFLGECLEHNPERGALAYPITE